jgi:maltose-binding protein MalE
LYSPTRASVSSVVIGGLVVLALSGCLGRRAEEAVTLTWWLPFAEGSAEYDAFQAITESYAEKTGQDVDLVPVPWTDIAPRVAGATRLSSTLADGAGPDVWGPVPHNWTSTYALEGQARALETTQVEDHNQYHDLALQATQFDGKQYALPVLMDSVALIYNRDLIPTPPKSFARLVEVAQELTDAEQGRWGLMLPLLSQYHTYPFVDAYGGYLLKCQGGQCDTDDVGLNNAGAIQGTQYLVDLYLEEGLFPEPLSDRAQMHDYALRTFTERKAAMLIDGPWALPAIKAKNIDYGVAAIPRMPETDSDPRPLTVVHAMVASAHTSHPEATIDLLNYIASRDSVVAMHAAWGRTPVRQDILRLPEFREDRRARAWRDQAESGVPLPNLPELDYVWTPWGQALNEAIPGLTPVQDALDRAVEQIRGTIEAEKDSQDS